MRRARWVAIGTGIALIAGASAAWAGYPDTVPVYTGCLNTSGNGAGTIVSLAQSATAPLKPCGQNQVVVHLSGGTITQITAGTGLTGGGNNGSVTLNLASSYALPQGCAVGKVVKWNGTAWTCADDQTYTNGTGLDLNSNTFSINSHYRLPQSCASGQIAKSGGPSTDWTCADQNSYSGNDFALSNQTCNSGQFVNGIDSTGHTQCSNDQTYTGANFALSNQGCSAGDYVSSIGASGQVVCTPDSVYTPTFYIARVNLSVTQVDTAQTRHEDEASCPDGYSVVGGGVSTQGGTEGSIVDSYPNTAGPTQGWTGAIAINYVGSDTTDDVSVYAVCEKNS
jgi:hypothetical protein